MPIRAANKELQNIRHESARVALHMIISCMGAKHTREPGPARDHESEGGGENGPVLRTGDGLNDPAHAPVLGDRHADRFVQEEPVSEHG